MAKKEGMSRSTLRKILIFESPPGYGGRSIPKPQQRSLSLSPSIPHVDIVRQRWMEWLYDLERGALPSNSLQSALYGLGRYRRKKVLAVMARRSGFTINAIVDHLGLSKTTVRRCSALFDTGGLDALLGRKKLPRKADDDAFRAALFSLLHEPPSLSGFIRTTWRMADLKKTLVARGFSASDDVIREAIRNTGFRWRSAKVVLTSTDPEYRQKLQRVQDVLSHLGDNERFFSIDEYGPFAVKAKPGRILAGPGESPSVPQWQKSKGWLIATAALELSHNRVTHFYSRAKNTTEMIRMAEILLNEYRTAKTLYLSWDAASWHMSKQLLAFVDKNNARADGMPRIELAPLPASAQFLNVIESVFSGMARAIIHNSDYSSVEAASEAIDRYFEERNRYYAENPKPAGNKIWGKERTEATFDPANNCKDPAYR
ncbi:IS630 family transposase [Pseudomonas sp. ANT_J12]|nr:IS630 family transposase [Pseudomonas sp. ANT_J12]KAA0982649.1 IS630 family transposase [Pseudomonas sp. ANT_J12]